MIDNITRPIAKQLREELQEAIQTVAKKHGLQITMGNCTVDTYGSYANFKMEVATKNDNGRAKTKQSEDYLKRCHFHNLKPEYLGQEFEWHGTKFRLDGLNTRSVQYPILGTRLRDNRKVKMPAHWVRMAFENKG